MATCPRDTHPVAYEKQLDFYRRIDPSARVELALEMSAQARQIAADGIRTRHPEYSETEIRHALARIILGDSLVRLAWPNTPLVRP